MILHTIFIFIHVDNGMAIGGGFWINDNTDNKNTTMSINPIYNNNQGSMGKSYSSFGLINQEERAETSTCTC